MTRIIRVPFLLAWPPNGYAAQVLTPNTILLKRGVTPSRWLIAHELTHIDQINDLGLLQYWWRYLRLLLARGYDDHPMEIEARHMERNARQLDRAEEVIAWHSP